MNRYKIFIGLIGLEIYCLLIDNLWDGERGGGSVKKIPPTTGHYNKAARMGWRSAIRVNGNEKKKKKMESACNYS